MTKPIVIDTIDHKNPKDTGFVGEMLAGCYFYPTGDETYMLVSKFDIPLASDLKTGNAFAFNLGPFAWGVGKDFSICEDGASGSWVANVPRLAPLHPPGDDDADGEGSFQAQAGTHGMETAVAAKAY